MRVLILCTGNSCRSQMAEVLWQHLGNDQWQADSAGSKPAGYVHPMALAAIKEIGLSTEGLRSKSVDEFDEQAMDLVITVCDNAQEACPNYPNAGQQLHWPFEDPADAVGTEEEKRDFFRKVRDQISTRIEQYLKERSAA